MRVAVVGVAGIGQAHLFAVKAVDGMELAGVFDVDAARAAEAATEHKTSVFATYAALCRDRTIDAVVIATPPATHAPLVREAAQAGKHVYCEKPFTPTAGAGYELAELVESCGVTVQVGLQFRYHHTLRGCAQAHHQRCDRRSVPRQHRRDELVPRAALLRCEPVARRLEHVGRGSVAHPSDPPT